jgi:hypothetical protein
MANQQRLQEKNNRKAYEAQIAAMKEEVLERELRARFAKANYELMYFSLEAEKIQPEYKEFVDREQAKQAEAQKQREEFFAKLKESQESKPNEELLNTDSSEDVTSKASLELKEEETV